MWTGKAVYSPLTTLYSRPRTDVNTLIQDKQSLLIGSREAIKRLSGADEAKVLCVSDSHGAYYSFRAILQYIGESCSALVFCGDGIRDIARLIENALDEPAFRRCIPPVIGVVEGNNDADFYPVRNIKAASPYYTELKVPLSNTIDVCGKKIFFTHGHRYSLYMGEQNVTRAAEAAGARIALFGHTHVPYENIGKVFVLNPGSCYIPRYGRTPTFATLFLKKNSDSIESVFYELASTGCRPVSLDEVF